MSTEPTLLGRPVLPPSDARGSRSMRFAPPIGNAAVFGMVAPDVAPPDPVEVNDRVAPTRLGARQFHDRPLSLNIAAAGTVTIWAFGESNRNTFANNELLRCFHR